MRKLLCILAIVFLSGSLWAQGNRVDFHLNDIGSFVRTDNNKNYYIFEYDPNMSEDDLKSLFESSLYQINALPDYIARFENKCHYIHHGHYYFSKETIEGVTPCEYYGTEVISVKYAFRVLFKQGRVRIDPPVLTINRHSFGSYMNGVYVFGSGSHHENTLYEWWSKNEEGHSYKETEISKRKQYITELANSLINGLLEYIDSKNMAPDWENVQELPQKGETAFKFGNSFCFEYPDSADYKVFRINGASKIELIKLIYNYYSKDYKMSGLSLFDNGVQLASAKTVNIHSIIGNKTLIPHEFRFALYLECEDNLVKVYLPKILSVVNNTTSGEVNFPSFLIVNKICNKDGTHNQTDKRREDIRTIDTEFNNLALGPLYFIKEYQEKVRKEQEDKENW